MKNYKSGSMVVVMVVTLLLPTPSSASSAHQPLTEEVSRLITEWAPLIWLHSEEIYFPSSVDYFLFNTEVRDENETVIESIVDRYTIPTGPETNAYHLNTVPDLPCLDCHLDWFGGQSVLEAEVPTHVFVRDYKDDCGTIDVAYRAFYPYNYGKDVCVGVSIGGVCEGVMQSFGNHVGDWEHFTIRIRSGKVTDCYVAVHSFGAYYSWNDTTHNFQLVRGERRGVVDVPYPETVEVVEGTTHPELFSANGSHGLWGREGTHEYVHFPIHLQDKTDKGIAWETWRKMEIVNWEDDMDLGGSEYNYLGYRGRWGNLGDGCGIIEAVAGECVLNSGPTLYPPQPKDFPAHDC